STYDSGRANSVKNQKIRTAIAHLNRPFLHAGKLSFNHPVSAERLNFTAPLPNDLEKFLAVIRG
ncbi:MAG TPA: RNA pseudouridine synthase, partial [Blastocatellia bacterium]|nr:RNA pseudouridine synthase [Blastocatellia bacterium]